MKIFKADLHIHSCLSPCGDLDMSPKAIVKESKKKDLDIIAICDHNSAENVSAVVRAGKEAGICVIPGLEICSKEEVHLIALFNDEMDALKMQDVIYRNLEGTNRPEIFGDQIVANEYDEVEGINDRLLIGATHLNIYEIEDTIHRLKGICILSHVDRPSYSVFSQLGFIPEDLKVDAIEISREIQGRVKSLVHKYPIIHSSDAHFLNDIGRKYTEFYMEKAEFREIGMALRGEMGRRILS